MSENRKIADNVSVFLNQASKDFSRIHEARFSQFMYTSMLEDGLSSPIEDLFFIAFNLQCAAEYHEVNPLTVPGANGKPIEGDGVFIKAQQKIGKYRVDFLIYQNGIAPNDICTPVIVELDGHNFHDKDKYQRAYEKSRDRFLVKHGYKVLHFTGSEVVADPHKVAFESISVLGVNIVRDEYDPEFPLGEL